MNGGAAAAPHTSFHAVLVLMMIEADDDEPRRKDFPRLVQSSPIVAENYFSNNTGILEIRKIGSPTKIGAILFCCTACTAARRTSKPRTPFQSMLATAPSDNLHVAIAATSSAA